jgi:hypothetical protein
VDQQAPARRRYACSIRYSFHFDLKFLDHQLYDLNGKSRLRHFAAISPLVIGFAANLIHRCIVFGLAGFDAPRNSVEFAMEAPHSYGVFQEDASASVSLVLAVQSRHCSFHQSDSLHPLLPQFVTGTLPFLGHKQFIF